MLKGVAKKEYQRKYMRDYRQGLTRSNNNKVRSNAIMRSNVQGLTIDNPAKVKRHIPVSQIDKEGKEQRQTYYGCGCVKGQQLLCEVHQRA